MSRRITRRQRDDCGGDWITPGDGAIPIVPTPSAYTPPPTSAVHWPPASAPLLVASTHLFHLPHIKTWARGGPFGRFNAAATMTTSFVFKREPEEVFFAISTCLPPQPPSCPNASWTWFFQLFQCICTDHQWPPPSCPNASWRWSFLLFQRICHYYHPPHVQTRARGGFFGFLQRVCPLHYLPRIQTRAVGGVFGCFEATATNSGEYNPMMGI